MKFGQVILLSMYKFVYIRYLYYLCDTMDGIAAHNNPRIVSVKDFRVDADYDGEAVLWSSLVLT